MTRDNWFQRGRNSADPANDSPFSLDDVAANMQLDEVEPTRRDGPYSLTAPVVNDDIAYEVTITLDPSTNSVILGAELHPEVPLSRELAIDLLQENAPLVHGKLMVEPNEGEDTFRVILGTEMRSAHLTNDQFMDVFNSFDTAVTYEYRQLRRLAEKNQIQLDVSPSEEPKLLPRSRHYLFGDLDTE